MEKLKKNIAIQGISGSFHEEAAVVFFKNEDVNFIYCDTFSQVFNSLKDENTLGVIAIENSLAGSILPNYGAIQSNQLNIIGETYSRIEQNLMVLPKSNFDNIKEIWSHPMALRQCQPFLDKHPQIKSVEKEDTAKSAKIIKEKNLEHVAAIASKTAAKMYDLNILQESIESNKMNFTRFLLLSKLNKVIKEPNKATLCFSVPNTAGSLAKVLSILAEKGLNLTKIQSHPKIGKKWEYFFYVDLLFKDLVVFYEAINQLDDFVTELNVLGLYKNELSDES